MLDTKLRKTHKLTDGIIALCILVPALLLTALYPQMEKAAVEKKTEYEKAEEEWLSEQVETASYQRELNSSFNNMATEAAYYIYGNLLREASGEQVNMSALDTYGWISDYYVIREATDFYAELLVEEDATDVTEVPQTEDVLEVEEGTEVVQIPESESAPEEPVLEEVVIEKSHTANAQPGKYITSNADWDMSEILDWSDAKVMDLITARKADVFLQMEFNAYGELADVRCFAPDDIWMESNFYSSIMESMDQYQNNAEWIRDNMDGTMDPDEMLPKNLRVIYVLRDSEPFIVEYWQDAQYYSTNWQSIYLDIGAVVPVIILAVFVALAALLLPFIKKLETGWEKLFSIPFEIIAALIILGISGAFGMFVAMSETTMSNISSFTDSFGNISIIGLNLSDNVVYAGLLFLNFLGWAILFLAEYIVFASFRQFLCGPIRYIKERVLCVRILRWLKKQCIRLYDYVTDIDINEKLHGSIIKIVLVNFVILTLLCCLWFFGIAALAIYSVALYILLRKYGEKLQKQYHSVLHATNQMAEGNLKIEIEEDLGVLKPLGQELEKVQQGFAKAVAEEAKSQNMKTELITNVSHDLKTPLTAIITYVELLKKEDITEEERESYVKTIDQKTQRLKVLIDDLFEVSKASSGNIQMNFMDVDVVNLMKQVRLEMEEKIDKSNLSFRFNLPEEKLILSLDGQKTYRVFENLLNNVLKYSMPYSRVYVDILDQKSQVQIIIRNISAVELGDDPEHLTDRFVRGDASRKTEGSGLGLAIVKSFVELQNGKLDISIDGDLFKVSIIWNK